MATYDCEKLVYDAVKARLEADTGTGGLFGTNGPVCNGVFAEFPPNVTPHPWIQFNPSAAPSIGVFNADVVELTFQLAVYDVRDNAYENLSKIIHRIKGPGTINPSYGLHRHALNMGVGVGWTCSDVIWVSTDTNSNAQEQIYGRVLTFRVICQLA